MREHGESPGGRVGRETKHTEDGKLPVLAVGRVRAGGLQCSTEHPVLVLLVAQSLYSRPNL